MDVNCGPFTISLFSCPCSSIPSLVETSKVLGNLSCCWSLGRSKPIFRGNFRSHKSGCCGSPIFQTFRFGTLCDILSQLSCFWSFGRSHPIRSREQRQLPWMWIVDLSWFYLVLFKSVASQTFIGSFLWPKLHIFPSKKEKPFICSQ